MADYGSWQLARDVAIDGYDPNDSEDAPTEYEQHASVAAMAAPGDRWGELCRRIADAMRELEETNELYDANIYVYRSGSPGVVAANISIATYLEEHEGR